MKVITDPAEKGHKKKTKQNQIHKKPTPAGTGKNLQHGHNWRVCPCRASIVKGRDQRSGTRD